jgi:UDP-N-acetylglucosamine 1-carboxyvinyltransferase
MDKFIVKGGNRLMGSVTVSGAKNAALKALVAACLTDEIVTIHNIPLITDIFVMIEILKILGAKVELTDHTIQIQMKEFKQTSIPLDKAAMVRTSAMFIAPLLARNKEAKVPNPGGCRLGTRPIDRATEGICMMNANISYLSTDGYFHANTTGLKGVKYRFSKNTHTGTETMILAAVLAKGITTLENAAEEPEIDDLIGLLNAMGGKVKRSAKRVITITGVKKLHGAEYTIGPDRIEVVTFAIAAVITQGDLLIKDAHKANINAFLEKYRKTGAGFEKKDDGLRFYANGTLKAVDVTTAIHPGFLTDWQAPWAVLMTQADGKAIIHETVFENKLGYVYDLNKMGAHMELFNPVVENREITYNFSIINDRPEYFHAVCITGPKVLHDAVMTTLDIRAGAAIVLAALAANGTSTIYGVEKLDRGYEKFDERLRNLGGFIRRVKEKV